MAIGFIIMQIGNEHLDSVCANAIVPAVEACGFEARRVDKHNEGGLLKSEIIRFIQDADIIVADLTNERPNVYLEIGYVMGIDKFRNLIITAREDHLPDSESYIRGGPKVHFDLAGYDILPWKLDALEEFRDELEKRIRRRLAITARADATAVPIWDDEWIETQRGITDNGLAKVGLSGYMEVLGALHPPKIQSAHQTLNAAAEAAPIHTFGWPVGVYLHKEESKPRPRTDGIAAAIEGHGGASYDYWAIRLNGDFYTRMCLFEDERRENEVFFNTRIVRVTEAILYLLRLYSHLGADRTAMMSIRVRHGGLRGRTLTASSPNRNLHRSLSSGESESEAELKGSLDEFEANLVSKVKDILGPLFMLFDFFELSDQVYDDIVSRFVAGEVS